MKTRTLSRTSTTTTKQGKRLHYNASTELQYSRSLQKLVLRMTIATKRELSTLFRSQTANSYIKEVQDASLPSQAKVVISGLSLKFEQLFNRNAKPLSDTLVRQSERDAHIGIRYSLQNMLPEVSLKTDVVSKIGAQRSAAIVAENVALIKSIPSQYFTQIASSVMRSISAGAGGSLGSLIEVIQKHGEVTKRRAHLIALDQTRKAYQTISRQKMQDRGIRKFEWLHTGGSQHPRRSHMAMSGQVYLFSDPPIITLDQPNQPQVRGYPGDAINCRCTMRPIADWESEDDEE